MTKIKYFVWDVLLFTKHEAAVDQYANYKPPLVEEPPYVFSERMQSYAKEWMFFCVQDAEMNEIIHYYELGDNWLCT